MGERILCSWLRPNGSPELVTVIRHPQDRIFVRCEGVFGEQLPISTLVGHLYPAKDHLALLVWAALEETGRKEVETTVVPPVNGPKE